MNLKKYRNLFFLTIIFLGGCSNSEDETAPEKFSKEHVLKNQVQTLKRAEDVEQLMQNAAAKQRHLIEAQSQ